MTYNRFRSAGILRSGGYTILGRGDGPTTSASLGNNTYRAYPFVCPAPRTLTRIGAEITSGGDAATSVTDGVITATTNLQSSLTTFASGWVGRLVTGNANVPAGTYISAFVDSHNVTLSQACTNGTALTMTVSGCLLRIGIFYDDGTGQPGAYLIDGTIDGSSATVQDATINVPIPVGDYWACSVVQGVATVQPTVRQVGPLSMNQYVGTSIPTAGQAVSALAIGSQAAGPLLTTAPAMNASGTMPPRVHVKCA